VATLSTVKLEQPPVTNTMHLSLVFDEADGVIRIETKHPPLKAAFTIGYKLKGDEARALAAALREWAGP
jgi:hypothetical protein